MEFKYESTQAYKTICELEKEFFNFFWGGEFSQWHPSKFTISGVEFRTAEHYMMYQKAILMGDTVTAQKILNNKSASDVKQYGREITPFDPQKWEKYKCGIVYAGNFAKFTQNRHLLDYLLSTKGVTIVEAAPNDKIWGIGLHETDVRVYDRSQWEGENLLGRILTQLRCDLTDDQY